MFEKKVSNIKSYKNIATIESVLNWLGNVQYCYVEESLWKGKLQSFDL